MPNDQEVYDADVRERAIVPTDEQQGWGSMRGAVTFNQFVVALVFVVSLAVAAAVFGIMYLTAGSEPQPEVLHAVCDWEAADED